LRDKAVPQGGKHRIRAQQPRRRIYRNNGTVPDLGDGFGGCSDFRHCSPHNRAGIK